MAGKYYAVKVGRNTGIFTTWDQCKAQVDGFSKAVYKSFKTLSEAADYLELNVSVRENVTDKNEALTDLNNDKISEYGQADTRNSQEYGDGIAYVDGSYNIATKEFSYGVVMFHEGKEIHLSRKFSDEGLAEMRNVAGEIKGSEAAMEYAMNHGMKSLRIYHDYEGIARWPLRQWKANREGTIAYRNFYDRVSAVVDISFVKVKGHSGDKYNDLADSLAKEALGIK